MRPWDSAAATFGRVDRIKAGQVFGLIEIDFRLFGAKDGGGA
jgi:hypothetical protein